MPTNAFLPLRVADGTFAVVTSGFADGPAQALRRFLIEGGAARVIEVNHPLVSEGPSEHLVTDWRSGAPTTTRVRRRPNRPPLTYALDPFTPLLLPRSDAWFGFNCLVTAQGLAYRAARRTSAVVHWSVDFVPERFGPGIATKVYEALDSFVCRRSDARVDLSQAALEGRDAAYGLGARSAPASVVPMGAWLVDTPRTDRAHLEHPRVVFLGHLVQRMGIRTFIDSLGMLMERGVSIEADIIGGGPLLEDLRDDVATRGLGDRVVLHGFVEDFAEIRPILAAGAVAVAPYEPDPNSFSRFADPGKLKVYLAAGLPILLTDVPPNADELAASGGAEIVAPDATAFADAIQRLLGDHAEWQRRHLDALSYAVRFDWTTLLTEKLGQMGFVV